MSNCYHCGLPAHQEFSTEIQGTLQPFCCPGCSAVAQAIHSGGLQNYYSFRDKPAVKPADVEADFAIYDLSEVQQSFVIEESGVATAKLSVGGIACAACAWLIENQLSQFAGVDAVRVNATTRQAVLRWHPASLKLSEIFSHLARIGYAPAPAQNQQAQQQRQSEQRMALMRLAVAGFGMMQVGMVAIALYAGGEQGISAQWQALLRWVSLLMATPVIMFSAYPFFRSAIRCVKLGQLNMDVPVSLALLIAYSASFWATVSQSGEVYFDSVSMFTFFLLLGRFLELRARHSRAFETENLQQLLPRTAKKTDASGTAVVPLAALQVGDKLWVDAGAVVPADGIVLSDNAALDESLITGESEWQVKQIGEAALAGTIAGDTAFAMRVTALGEATQLAAIEKLLTVAALEKPRQVALADKIAAKFVAALLLVAAVVAGYWWYKDSTQTLWVLLSVLVVTCPCALSLATPAALTAGVNRSRRLGVMILSSHVLESLSTITHVLIDKTGTLTEGKFSLTQTQVLRDTHFEPIALVAALEKHSRHPIAHALEAWHTNNAAPLPLVQKVKTHGGRGVEGSVAGVMYRFGKPDFCRELSTTPSIQSSAQWQFPGEGMWQVLADCRGPIAWLKFSDALRQSAQEAIKQLQQQGKALRLISGDRRQNVASVAAHLGIEHWEAQATPEMKLNQLSACQRAGAKVLMIGDGINDLPVLGAADISMAMGSATQLAQTRADAVLFSGDLRAVAKLGELAQRVQSIIKQNIAWALVYNLVALPAAAAGFVPPWLAAIGMSASSLVVVCNAMRV